MILWAGPCYTTLRKYPCVPAPYCQPNPLAPLLLTSQILLSWIKCKWKLDLWETMKIHMPSGQVSAVMRLPWCWWCQLQTAVAHSCLVHRPALSRYLALTRKYSYTHLMRPVLQPFNTAAEEELRELSALLQITLLASSWAVTQIQAVTCAVYIATLVCSDKSSGINTVNRTYAQFPRISQCSLL